MSEELSIHEELLDEADQRANEYRKKIRPRVFPVYFRTMTEAEKALQAGNRGEVQEKYKGRNIESEHIELFVEMLSSESLLQAWANRFVGKHGKAPTLEQLEEMAILSRLAEAYASTITPSSAESYLLEVSE